MIVGKRGTRDDRFAVMKDDSAHPFSIVPRFLCIIDKPNKPKARNEPNQPV